MTKELVIGGISIDSDGVFYGLNSSYNLKKMEAIISYFMEYHLEPNSGISLLKQGKEIFERMIGVDSLDGPTSKGDFFSHLQRYEEIVEWIKANPPISENSIFIPKYEFLTSETISDFITKNDKTEIPHREVTKCASSMISSTVSKELYLGQNQDEKMISFFKTLDETPKYKQIPKFIISNGSKKNIEDVLIHTGIKNSVSEDFFDLILSVEEIPALNKIYPDAYLQYYDLITKKHPNLPIEHIVHLGDNINTDVRSSKAVGMTPILVLGGRNASEVDPKGEAYSYVEHLSEFLPMLEKAQIKKYN